MEGVAHADDALLEPVDVDHCTGVHPDAEERQIDHAEHRYAVLEQAEHHTAQW
jgi:hypothetical protein